MKTAASLLLVLATFAAAAFAQTPGSPAPPPPPVVTAAPPVVTAAPPIVAPTPTPVRTFLFPDTALDGPNADNMGVVLASVKGTMPVVDKEVHFAMHDTIVVRIRNFDGWIISKLESRQISGEPVMSLAAREAYLELKNLKSSIATDDFLKKYEDGKLPTKKDGTPKALPANWTWPDLPKEKIAKFREAQRGYRALLDYAKQNLYLVMNNSHFVGITAENPEAGSLSAEAQAGPDDTIHELAFRIRRLPGDAKEWDKLYDGTRAIHDVKVTLGLRFDKSPAGQVFTLSSAVHPAAPKLVQRVKLELYSTGWLWFVLVGIGILAWAMFRLGQETDLLRDSDLQVRADGRSQYSIARVQLGFWIFLCVGAFLAIWLVTDRLDTLNPGILALLGISSGTMFASKLANSVTLTGGSVPPDPIRRARAGTHPSDLLIALKAERKVLREQAAQLSPEATEEERRKLQMRIEQNDSDITYVNHSGITRFFIDLLSENGRISLNRMQILVWTLVLGVVFITRVWRELAMPEFSETLLGLMGLSSATYVALKVPELKKVEAQAAANRKGKEKDDET